MEVKQVSVAEGLGAETESGEVRQTGSYNAVLCPQTEVPAPSVTFPFLMSLTLLSGTL